MHRKARNQRTIADAAVEAYGLLGEIGAALVFEVGDERPAGALAAVGKATTAAQDLALALCGLPKAPNCEIEPNEPDAWKRLGDTEIKVGCKPFGRDDIAAMSALWEGGDGN